MAAGDRRGCSKPARGVVWSGALSDERNKSSREETDEKRIEGKRRRSKRYPIIDGMRVIFGGFRSPTTLETQLRRAFVFVHSKCSCVR
jgi:hypothetical protein